MTDFKLEDYLYRLINDWEKDRRDYPDDELEPADEVLRPLWEPVEWLNSNSSASTIAEVVKRGVINYWGDMYWNEMQDYVATLPDSFREGIDLRSLVEAFDGVFLDNGDPWCFERLEDETE